MSIRSIVNATQISQWFDSKRRDAWEILPLLLRKLVSASIDLKEMTAIRSPGTEDLVSQPTSP